jgi:CRISPR-associated protein Csd2
MNHRYDFLFLFDCQDANPNGDPDAGNLPRIDVETGQGLVTDVCLKRKIRNFVHLTKQGIRGLEIFIQEKRPLNPLLVKACEDVGVPSHCKDGKRNKEKTDARPQSEIRAAQKWLCENYFDIRTFGGVLSTGPNCGQIRGPVQISFARSISPIVTSEHCITRLTDVDKEEGEMGRKFTIPYGLYKAQGFVNPFLANQTGFSDEDLELLFTSLENAFQFDQSAARPAGSMNPRALIVFKHDSQLGNAPSHKLFERVTVKKKDGVEAPRAFSDYEVTIYRSGLPAGVEIIERI